MTKHFNKVLSRYNGDIMQVTELSEFIANRLYFVVLSDEKTSTTLQSFRHWKLSFNTKDVFYLNVDDELSYTPFYLDFGPLNLGAVYRYVGILKKKLSTYGKVVHCTHIKNQKRTSNAAFLIGAYMIIEENWTAHQAYAALSQQYLYNYKPFRDAAFLNSTIHTISVEECLNALYKAKWYGFFDFGDFDLFEYEYYSNPKFGDISWILPDSLLAFSSPCSQNYVHKCNKQNNCTHIAHPPDFYYRYFNEKYVKHVVRLNSSVKYNAKSTFVGVANIEHTEMNFSDGTPPPVSILTSFLRLCEQYIDNDPEVESLENETSESNANHLSNIIDNEVVPLTKGAIAVHCKAGLGRTGCLIAAYIIKHWSFTAHEAIAWARICRPGSVFGVQQQWLVNNEQYLQLAGRQWRENRKIPVDRHKCFQNGVYSLRQNSVCRNMYEYVDEPPEVNYTDYEQPSNYNSTSEMKCVQPEKYDPKMLPPPTKFALKKNNNVLYLKNEQYNQKMLPPPTKFTLTTNNNVFDPEDEQVLDLSQKKLSSNDETQSFNSSLLRKKNFEDQVKYIEVGEVNNVTKSTTESQK